MPFIEWESCAVLRKGLFPIGIRIIPYSDFGGHVKTNRCQQVTKSNYIGAIRECACFTTGFRLQSMSRNYKQQNISFSLEMLKEVRSRAKRPQFKTISNFVRAAVADALLKEEGKDDRLAASLKAYNRRKKRRR